ncbi:hypothetical protein A2U01_0013533, partial [Trifolium medium]|nr:hypothetical protein [Trifolium medium]
GHYSPPVPTDLLEKLAAMKVNTSQDTPTKHNQPKPANQHTQNYENPTMNGIQTTQEDRGKKAHRLTFNNEAMNMENTQELTAQNQSFQAKRQKMEDSSRVGSARQASPQP